MTLSSAPPLPVHVEARDADGHPEQPAVLNELYRAFESELLVPHR